MNTSINRASITIIIVSAKFSKTWSKIKIKARKNSKHRTTKHKRRSIPILKSDVLHESSSMRPLTFQGSSFKALSRKNADRTQKSSREATNKVWPAIYNQLQRQIRHHDKQIIQLSISHQMSCTLIAKEIRWQFWKLTMLRFQININKLENNFDRPYSIHY